MLRICKKILLLFFCILFLTGCGKFGYNEVILTEDNIDEYIELVINRGNGAYSVDYRVKIRPINNSYKFEDVSFDLWLVDCHCYKSGFVAENIDVYEYGIELDSSGKYYFETSVTTDKRIVKLCSSSIFEIFKNVNGKVFVP